MDIVSWILQVVLAVAFLGAGGIKLARPKPALVAAGQTYVEDFTDTQVKAIGAIEVLGVLALVLAVLRFMTPQP